MMISLETNKCENNNQKKIASLIRKSNSLVRKGRFEEAINAVNEAISLDPNCPKSHIQLANIYKNNNEIALAVECMQKALEIEPENTSLQEELFSVLLELGRYDETLKISKRCLDVSPRNLMALDAMAVAYLQKGLLDKALKIINRMIALCPMDPINFYKKATLLQQKGEITKAMAAFLQALEMDPTGELANEARDAITSLDSYQLKQVLTIALEDSVFRAKLILDMENALIERGFLLSPGGIAILKQIDMQTLPIDSEHKYYN
ncbi:MAG: tetratricopeptide repeat protein [Armatimonadota bacterium]